MGKADSSSKVRLQKFMAHCGVASRRSAEELIRAGKVKVNGQITTTMGVSIDPEQDIVEVSGNVLKHAQKGIILFHKPKHVVSTMSDPQGRPCIADYLTSRYRAYYPVGRLDFDSSGLMILTNDGELAERLMHPRYGFEREYRVTVSGEVSDAIFARVERGVKLDDGDIRGDIKGVEHRGNTTTFLITIGEGRNRIIRRLFEHLGFPVEVLIRLKHGPFQLAKLPVGQLIKLTEKEYLQIRHKILY